MNEATYKKQSIAPDELNMDDEQIVHYLEQHPEFFELHSSLLNSLSIPHKAQGQTVSLIERQVASLRDENKHLKRQLDTIINNAGENEALMDKTKKLILSLITARSFDQLKLLVERSMTREFGSNCCRLWQVVENGTDLKTQRISVLDADKHLKRIVGDKHVKCGILKDQEKQWLFEEKAELIGSAATLPLFSENKLVGVLSIGNNDPDYYRNNMSTSLLSYLGSVIARVLTTLPE
jgi:hypothetical protein